MAKAQTVRSRARSSQRNVGADEAPVDPALPQKKRARHRLIGAIVLCVLAAIIVPLLLEPEPTRPLADLSVVIPPKTTNLPSRGPEPRSDAKPDAARRDSKTPQAVAGDKSAEMLKSEAPRSEMPRSEMPRSAESRAADVASLESAPTASAAPGAQADTDRTKSSVTAEISAGASGSSTGSAIVAPSPAVPAAKATAASSVAAIPSTDNGKQPAAKPAGKYLIQVGAFSTEAAATSALERIQSAGLRGFTEKIKTDRGERIRVRAGPFSSRDAADQAREKLKASGLEAALIAPS